MLDNLTMEMRIKDVTKTKVSAVIGVSYATIINKFKGRTEWTRSEMFKIADLLNEDVDYLFEKGE